MEQRFWFALVNEVGAPLGSLTSVFLKIKDVDMFRKAVFADVHRNLPANVSAHDLNVFPNHAAFKHKQALTPGESIEAFGASLNEPLVVQATLQVPPQASLPELGIGKLQNGVDPDSPHVSRARLLASIKHLLIKYQNRFVLLASPSASGKTSVLSLFARRYRDLQCHYVSFAVPLESPAEALLRGGHVDVERGTTTLSSAQYHVVMIDDAQAKYEDQAFWTKLIKVTDATLPLNVLFIICATHLLEGGTVSPVEFQTLPTFGRDAFLLTTHQAHEMLTLPVPIGLPDHLRFSALTEMMVHECNGLVGALRMSVDVVVEHFDKAYPSETDLIRFYLSNTCLQRMARCFGSKHMTPTSTELRQFLVRCLARDEVQYAKPPQAEQDKQCWMSLMKSGILVEDADGVLGFSSPLAEKYYTKYLYPNRAFINPSSLEELIMKVLGNMSASVLRLSVTPNSEDFPKEATFQHQFMEGLTLFTTRACLVCPELSRVFPRSPSNGSRPPTIKGAIDFYLNGTLRWGLELLVNGSKIGEHISRFGLNGKYKPLDVNDYAVIDLRRSNSQGFRNVDDKDKRVTVVFSQDFSHCSCRFGLDKKVHTIALNP